MPPKPEPGPEPVVIPNCWYAVAAATAVRPNRPVGLERLGQRWVVWRGASGELACLPAVCPHRGADLSLGRVREGEIECPYHGFRFARSGACTRMPCEGREARVPSGLRAQPPVIREAHGLLWMWRGPGEALGEPPWIEGAPEPGPRHSTREEAWSISFTRVMEGMQDLHHFPFAHSTLDPWRGRATRLDPYEFEAEGERLRQRAGLRRDQPGASPVATFDMETAFPATVHLRLSERMDGTVVCCPIDDERTWVWACYRVRSGLGALVDRVGSWLGLWAEFKLVQPDDKRMLASSQPQRATAADSNLVRADAQIAAWHKLRRARLRYEPGDERLG